MPYLFTLTSQVRNSTIFSDYARDATPTSVWGFSVLIALTLDPSTVSDNLKKSIIFEYIVTSGAWLLIVDPYGAKPSICVDYCLYSSDKKP